MQARLSHFHAESYVSYTASSVHPPKNNKSSGQQWVKSTLCNVHHMKRESRHNCSHSYTQGNNDWSSCSVPCDWVCAGHCTNRRKGARVLHTYSLTPTKPTDVGLARLKYRPSALKQHLHHSHNRYLTRSTPCSNTTIPAQAPVACPSTHPTRATSQLSMSCSAVRLEPAAAAGTRAGAAASRTNNQCPNQQQSHPMRQKQRKQQHDTPKGAPSNCRKPHSKQPHHHHPEAVVTSAAHTTPLHAVHAATQPQASIRSLFCCQAGYAATRRHLQRPMSQGAHTVYEIPAGVASMTCRIFLSPASTAMAPSGSTSMMTTSPSLMSPHKMRSAKQSSMRRMMARRRGRAP